MSITLVQSNKVNSAGSVTSQAITLSSGATLGNLLVVAFATGNNATTLTGPTRWTQAVINQPAGASATIETAIFWLVVGASDAGATSFTFTLSASHTAYICIEEWNSSTGWPASPVDVTAQGDTIGTPVTSTTISSGTTATTAQASELWVASLAYKNSAQTESSITSGWTKDLEATLASNNTMTLLYQIASSTGTASCSYTIGAAEFWAGAVATFMPNAGITNNTMAATDALTVSDSALFTDGLSGTLVYQVASDTFTRANQSGWGTASSGRTWSTNGAGTLSIASNEGVLVSLASDTNVQLGSVNIDDADILCRFSVNLSGDVAGVQARYTANNGATTCYKLLYYSSNLNINKSINGNVTNLISTGVSLTLTTFYWLRFRVVGNALSGKFWLDGTGEPGAWTLTTIDSTIVGAGGVGVLANTATSSAGAQFDHFTATDYNVDAVPVSDAVLFSDGAIATEALATSDSFAATESYLPLESLTVTDPYLATDTAIVLDGLTVSDLLLSTDAALLIEALTPVDGVLATDGTLLIDASTVSDLQSALQAWPIDALSITDSLLGIETYLPLDALSVSDAMLGNDTASSTESLSVADSARMQDGYAPVDALSVSDALQGSGSYLPIDALATSDALVSQDGYLPIDALSVIDTASYTDLLNTTEALTVSEVPLVTDTYLPIDASSVSDSGGLTQTSSGGITNNMMSSTDSLIVTDGYLATEATLPVELLSSSDVLLSTDGVSAIEANTVTDTLVNGTVSIATENLSISEVFGGGSTYQAIETQSVADSFVESIGYNVIDANVISDLASALQSWVVDSLSVSDSFVAQEGYFPIEAGSIADTLSSAGGYSTLESLTASDVLNGGSIYQPTDTLTAIDLFAGLTTYNVTDANIISDMLVAGNAYSATDGLSISDTVFYTFLLGSIELLTIFDSVLQSDGYSSVDGLSIADLSSMSQTSPMGNNLMSSIDQLFIIDISACFSAFIIPSNTIRRTLTTTSGKRMLITISGKRTLTTTSGKRTLTQP